MTPSASAATSRPNTPIVRVPGMSECIDERVH
jgi:hypothetical protein